MESARPKLSANRALILVLTVFTVMAAIYACVTRLKWGPDEPAHFIYIRSLAVDFSLPPISHEETKDESSASSHEAHQPPLYYAVMAIPCAVMRALGVSSDLTWRILRLLNVPLGILWLLGVYALGMEFFGDRAKATAATAFVALIPMSSYTTGVVNNENLISPLFTWSMVYLLAYFKSGAISKRSALTLGLLIGLAVLTKAQGLVLIPMMLIVSIAVLRRDDYRDWTAVVGSLAIVLGAALVVSGWWFVRSWLVNGDLVPVSLYHPAFPAGLPMVFAAPGIVLAASIGATCLTYGHFWIPYWMVQQFVSYMSCFYVLAALSVFVVTGFIRRMLMRNGVDRRSVALLLCAPAMVYLAWLRYALFVDSGTNLQGRLFLCVAAVVGIVWVLGIEGLTRWEKVRAALRCTAYAAFMCASVAIILAAPYQR